LTKLIIDVIEIKMVSDSIDLFKKILYLGVVRFLGFFSPMIYLGVLIRNYGLSGYGEFAQALAISVIFMQVIDYGFNLHVPKAIAENKNNKKIFQLIIVAKFINVLISSIIITSYYVFTGNNVVTAGIIVVYLFIQVFNISWLLQGRERIKELSYYFALDKIIFIIMILLLTWYKVDASTLLVSLCVSSIFSILYQYYNSYRDEIIDFNLKGIKLYELKELYSSSWGYFYSRMAFSLYSNAGVLILSMLSTSEIVGIYSSVEKIYGAAKSMMGVVTTNLYPYMCRTKNIYIFSRFFCLFTFISIISCLLVSYFSNEILLIIVSNVTDDMSRLLIVFMLCLFFCVPSMLIGYPLLGAFGYANIVNSSTLYTCLLYFILIALSFYFYKIDIFVISIIVLITEIFCFCYRSVFVFKLLRDNYNVQSIS
ncbi:hypothetical protein C0W42_22555, partial [Photobacterium kishitanii]|uniref:oligosaccharide flippase family protein n=1 Tax=Photobacterium kishitanii TaxID=318456 RepID=UPI000D41F0E3